MLINVPPLFLASELAVDTATDETMMKLPRGLRDHVQEARPNGWRAPEAYRHYFGLVERSRAIKRDKA